jgi:hypothetical protein
LDFQLLASYPVNIELIYKVESTSANIVSLSSTFTPASGPPVPLIAESACGSDPTPPGACSPLLATVTNTSGGITLTPTFGPVSTVWVDKIVNDPGFSSFTDAVQTGSATPEPAYLGVFSASLLGLGFLVRRFKAQK